ncbi:MAG: hypothetical protein ACRD2Z_05125 [Thermoanaerobaculia bacterium]
MKSVNGANIADCEQRPVVTGWFAELTAAILAQDPLMHLTPARFLSSPGL